MPYPSETQQAIADGFDGVCGMWSLSETDKMKLLGVRPHIYIPTQSQQIERMLIIMGVSIGLGDLFDDDFNSEVEWLKTPRDELRGRSPLRHMLVGDLPNIRDVADLVERERGLR